LTNAVINNDEITITITDNNSVNSPNGIQITEYTFKILVIYLN